MRIGIIGWYGHGNAGDERLLYCLRRRLKDHEVLVFDGFSGAVEDRDTLNRCDLVLLGGGGLILRGFGMYAWLFEQLRPPFACIGISVEAIHSDNRALLQVIKEKSEFILVRDERSRLLLDCHPKVLVGPDLTFLEPFEVVDLPLNNTCGVNLRAWQWWNAEIHSRLDRYMRRLDRHIPFLHTLYPLPKWSPQRAVTILRRHFEHLIPLPFYTEPNVVSDAQVMEPFLGPMEEKFDPARMAACSHIVAMRLHALIFACQMGIPFLSLTYQPKNLEFCRSLGLETLSANLFRPSALPHMIERMRDESTHLRTRLIEARESYYREITHIIRELLP